ncbi:hypothetical protein BpHYR1_037350 [Brachionus plicatilis]|uniref:Uncharacterized protein n=1 Tax=Brachionus plicatilis TaxID=10195 RepID=A0A3M7SBA2_BRAPC|nr:hypothetical protein BpHYR1_037350 [Brachionus plicatilis]
MGIFKFDRERRMNYFKDFALDSVFLVKGFKSNVALWLCRIIK